MPHGGCRCRHHGRTSWNSGRRLCPPARHGSAAGGLDPGVRDPLLHLHARWRAGGRILVESCARGSRQQRQVRSGWPGGRDRRLSARAVPSVPRDDEIPGGLPDLQGRHHGAAGDRRGLFGRRTRLERRRDGALRHLGVDLRRDRGGSGLQGCSTGRSDRGGRS